MGFVAREADQAVGILLQNVGSGARSLAPAAAPPAQCNLSPGRPPTMGAAYPPTHRRRMLSPPRTLHLQMHAGPRPVPCFPSGFIFPTRPCARLPCRQRSTAIPATPSAQPRARRARCCPTSFAPNNPHAGACYFVNLTPAAPAACRTCVLAAHHAPAAACARVHPVSRWLCSHPQPAVSGGRAPLVEPSLLWCTLIPHAPESGPQRRLPGSLGADRTAQPPVFRLPTAYFSPLFKAHAPGHHLGRVPGHSLLPAAPVRI
jgi:hypothetical protein